MYRRWTKVKFLWSHICDRTRTPVKEYKDALPRDEGSILFPTLCDIIKLLTFHGESKPGLFTYYIKFCHGKNVMIICLIGLGKWI